MRMRGGACAERHRHGPAAIMEERVTATTVRRWALAVSTARYWLPALQVVGLVACIALVLWPQLKSSFEASNRYRGVAASDWNATNVWLKSAECARETGAWLVICEHGKLLPISDRALADDPGHALILAVWARVADRPMTVIDVAHLNLTINLVGLLMLAATLLLLRAYIPAVVLLLFGPYVFLEWFGTSPHWALIGLSALQAILPLGVIAWWRRWASPASGLCFILTGILALAFASLVREVIAQMTLIVTLGTLVWIAIFTWRSERRLAGLLVIALAALLASQTARLTVSLRDRIYHVEPAELVATHGMSHTLFIGLGTVENKFGIRYDDSVGKEAAAKAAPDVTYLSQDYFRVMWSLYFARWSEDPLEILRIYLNKLCLILGDRIPDFFPPIWLFLGLVLPIHWMANGRAGSLGNPGCDRRLAVNLVGLSFLGLFVVQAILSQPNRFYAAPIGAFTIVMLGVAIENLACWLWRTVRTRLAKRAVRSTGMEIV